MFLCFYVCMFSQLNPLTIGIFSNYEIRFDIMCRKENYQILLQRLLKC